MYKTKYIPIETTKDGENAISVSVGFSDGGYNWYNGDNESKGYYLYCNPCNVATHQMHDGTEYKTFTETLGKGAKILLKEIKRRSEKQMKEAFSIASEKEAALVEYVCSKYGLIIKEEN